MYTSINNRYYLLLFFCLINTSVFSQAVLPFSKNKLVVIAHRGNHVDVPENTIASFKEAIKAGADYVEVDLRTSKDGQLVVVHDATVDRTTDGKGRVADLTLAELRALKVLNGEKKSHRIPEFKEVLKVCKGEINIYLDFKEADVTQTWEQIRDAGMEKQVVVYLNKIPQYKQWRNVAPQMPLMTSLIDEVKNSAQLNIFLGQVKIEVLDNIASPDMVRTAGEKGVAVWLDVQNPSEGPDTWEEALAKGVHGLQTDHPAKLVAFLKDKGWRNAVPATAVLRTEKKKSGCITLKNIKYADVAGNENLLDAYVPRNHTDSTRVIVYIHGGSWSRGDKSEFPEAFIEELVGKRGYAVVSMNYRMVKDGKDLFPAQITDVEKALKFLTDKSKKYKYNGNEFVLMGGSAGAHLAMLYAYGHNTEKKVKGVVDLWGPTDLTDKTVRADGSDADNTVVRFLGEKDPNAQIAKDASPSYHLTKETGVPTILFHGGRDPLVHVSQAENLYKKLLSLGVPAQYELYPEDKHGMSAGSMVDVMEKMLVWLEKTYPAR